MVLVPNAVLFGITVLAGGVLVWLGGYSYRHWNEPGVTPFAVSSVLFGIGGICGGIVGLAETGTLVELDSPLWSDIAFSTWVLVVVPWLLFALQYTGRYTRFRKRTVGAAVLPTVGIVVLFGVQSVTGIEQTAVTQFFGTFALLYVLGLSTICCYLVVRTSYEYGHLSTVQGLLFTLAVIGPVFLLNLIETAATDIGATAVVFTYMLAFVLPAGVLVAAVFGYGMFDSTPAVGALGERAIPRETDDLVFVIDQGERVIKINRTAAETLDVPPTEPLGQPFDRLVEPSVDALRERETVELRTVDGRRRFDPQVTAFTDQHDRQLGVLVSLRDVTERELRKQRLEVLNRVLRHNLRNSVDVIKSNAEAIEADSDRAFAESIIDSADELAALSAKARSTDQLVSAPDRTTTRDLATVVQELTAVDTEVNVTTDLPADAPLGTDWEAFRAALDSAIENALKYADSSVTVTVEPSPNGYTVLVEDDGPGIPDAELASITAGSETPLQHGTGLGLWQLKWGITKISGQLSFDTEDGTTVRMVVSDRRTNGDD